MKNLLKIYRGFGLKRKNITSMSVLDIRSFEIIRKKVVEVTRKPIEFIHLDIIVKLLPGGLIKEAFVEAIFTDDPRPDELSIHARLVAKVVFSRKDSDATVWQPETMDLRFLENTDGTARWNLALEEEWPVFIR